MEKYYKVESLGNDTYLVGIKHPSSRGWMIWNSTDLIGLCAMLNRLGYTSNNNWTKLS